MQLHPGSSMEVCKNKRKAENCFLMMLAHHEHQTLAGYFANGDSFTVYTSLSAHNHVWMMS